MNLNLIFPDEAAKTEALEYFNRLKDNPDWIFLREKMIQADINDITEQLVDPTKEWKEGEEREAKRLRAYWIILSRLPEELIRALTENRPDIFIESDPYFQNVKEMAKQRNKR